MNFRSIFAALTALVLFSARTETASAQQFDWVGDTDANWSTGANWNPVGPPTSGVSRILLFNAPAPTFSDLNNDIVALGVNRLTFGSGAPVSYTLSGNGITFTGSAGGILNSSTVLQTLNLPLTLSAAISVTNNGTAAGTDLRLNGSITLSNNLLTFRGTGDTYVAGPVSGAGGITKTDSGTLVLGGVNTFTGNLTINQGSVTVAPGGVLYSGSGVAGAIVMGRGAGLSRLTLTAGAITGTGVQVVFGGTGANSTTQSTIDLGTYDAPTTVLTMGATMTYSNVGNPQGAVITGNNARIALFGGGRTFNVQDSTNAADDLTILVPIINGAVTGSITKTGGGTLVFGASNTYTGSTSIQMGTLVVAADAGISNASLNIAVSNVGAASLELRGAVSQTATGLTFYNSSSAANSFGSISLGGSGRFTLNGNLTVNNNNNPLQALITGSGSSVFTVSGGGTGRTWTINDSSNAAVDLLINAPSMVITESNQKIGAGTVRIESALSGAGGFDMRVGTIVLAGESTYTGGTTIRGGQIVLDYSSNAACNRYSSASALVLQGGTLRMLGNASADATQTIDNVTLGAAFDPLLVEVVGEAGRTTTLDLGNISRGLGGNYLDLRAAGTGEAAFRTSSGTAGAVLDFGTLDGDFATREAGAGSTRIVAFTDYDQKSDLSTVVSGDDLSSSVQYSGNLVRSVDLGSWRFNAPIAQTADLGGGRVTSAAGILVGAGAGSNDQTVTGGILAGDSGSELILNVTNDVGRLRLLSLITDTINISKFGEGTVELRGTNNFGGTLRVTSGTVEVTAASGTLARSIGDSAIVSIGGGTLDIADGISARIGGLSSALSLSNGTVNIGAGSTLILNMAATPGQNYTGAYVGDASTRIVKEGIGTWNINQDNNSGFLGSVLIERGLVIHGGTGVNGGLRNASSFTLYQDAALLLDDNGTSAARTRFNPEAAVTLVGARGVVSNVQAGLMHRVDVDRNEAEVIGSLTLGGGSSVIRLDNTGSSTEVTARAGISVAGGLTRNNNATLSVRGTYLGFDGDGTVAGFGGRTRLYFGTSDTTSNTGVGTAPAEFGSGPDSGTTRRIIPYIIAEFVGTPGATGNASGTAITTANLGNAFATYSDASDTSGAGLRALVIDPAQVKNGSVAETTTFAASMSADDNIRESLAADLSLAGNKTVQSLVLHNNAGATNVSVTGNGGGAVLTVNSGGFLFSGATGGITLTGFAGGIAVNNAAYITGNSLGVRNEYIVHQMNTSAAGSIIGSSLVTTNADFTKSGAGRLTFAAGVVNRFQGLVTINEGILEVSDDAHLGDSSSATNDVRLAGGTLRIAGTAFSENTRDFELVAGTLSQIELTAAAPHRITGSFTGGGSLRINTTGTGFTKAMQLGAVGTPFNFGDGRGDLIIGRSGSSNGWGDLDLTESAEVDIRVDELLIGDADQAGASGMAQGVLRLSLSNPNTITARTIVVGDNGSGDNTSNTFRSSIIFGQPPNVLNADTIIVGGRKGNGAFFFTPGGTVTIHGTGGAGTRADLYIADNNISTGTTSVGLVNATDSILDWSLNSLVIGRHFSSSGGANGTLTFDAGVIDAESIMLARPNYGGDSTTDANTKAFLNVNGTAELRFGNLRQGTGVATVNVAGLIGARASSPGVVENVRINLTNPTVWIDSGSTSLTFQSAASLAGSGGFHKIGSGTLYFDGVANHLGATELEAGLTVLGSTGQFTGGGAVAVDSGATFRIDAGGAVTAGNVATAGGLIVNGTIVGNVEVQSGGELSGTGSVGQTIVSTGGTLSPGNGVGELEIQGGTTIWEGGSTFKFEFKNAQGSVAGVDWDYLNMSTSILQIDATSINKINLLVDSWNADNSGHGGGPGTNSNGFDPFDNYSWLFASTAGLNPDFDTAALQNLFNVVATTPGAGVFGTGNPYDSVASGTFNVVRTGNDLYLNYAGASAIPEPTSILLSALATAGFGWRIRRRRRAAAGSEPAAPAAVSHDAAVADGVTGTDGAATA